MNAYPNAGNYLRPSFSVPVIAPSVDPDEGALISVAYNPEWQKILLGACTQMLQFAAYEGTDDEKKLAVARATTLMILLQNDISEVGTPYWDDEDAADADDTAPRTDQSWYGLIFDNEGVLEWKEQVGLWAISALVMIAATPAAGIAFYPIAKRFAVSFKKGDFGGVIRAFIDSTEVGRVDTYSPTAGVGQMNIEVPVPAAGFRAFDADPPALWLVMGDEANPAVVGTPKIQLLRKRLDENEVYPVSMRYNPETDEVQTDYDGDDVWQDNPGLDFRHATQYQFPPIDADDPRCQAAANMSRWVSDFLNDVTNTLGWATTAEGALTTVMGGVALAFPEIAAVGVLAFLGLDLATTLFSAGVTAIQAAFDNDTLDAMTCIFFCNAESDGTMTAEGLGQANADINDQIGGLAALVMTGMFLLVGEVGVTNWGAKGDAPADCDGCDCAWRGFIDLTTDVWTYVVETEPPWNGNWGVYSSGWRATNHGPDVDGNYTTQINIQGVFPTGNYRKVRMLAVQTLGALAVDVHTAQFTIAGESTIATTDTGDITIEWTGNRDSTSGSLALRVFAISAYGSTAGANPGSFVHYRLEAEGFGDLPDGFTEY